MAPYGSTLQLVPRKLTASVFRATTGRRGRSSPEGAPALAGPENFGGRRAKSPLLLYHLFFLFFL